MSHEDSLDDEVKRLLANTDTDDSKESNKFKKKNDEYNTIEESDDKELDDADW